MCPRAGLSSDFILYFCAEMMCNKSILIILTNICLKIIHLIHLVFHVNFVELTISLENLS